VKIKCHLCRAWNERTKRYEYSLAEKTDWKPLPGHDPNLRQFKCAACGELSYRVLDAAGSAQEFTENHPPSC